MLRHNATHITVTQTEGKGSAPIGEPRLSAPDRCHRAAPSRARRCRKLPRAVGASPSCRGRFMLTSHRCLQPPLLAQPPRSPRHAGLHGEQAGKKQTPKKNPTKQNTSRFLSPDLHGQCHRTRLLCPGPHKTCVKPLEGSSVKCF